MDRKTRPKTGAPQPPSPELRGSDRRARPFLIFDRPRSTDPWQPPLEELRLSADPARRALGANWRMDHRVSVDREAGDIAAVVPFRTAATESAWLQGLRLYAKEEIEQPPRHGGPGKCSACLRSTNESNDVSTRVAAFDQLVHVGCLQGVLERIRPAAMDSLNMQLRGLDPALRIRDRPRAGSLEHWRREADRLATALAGRGESEVKGVVGLIGDAMGDSEPLWWASFAEEVGSFIDADDAAGLCAALGLGHRGDGDWLLIWRYPVGDAGPLFRPTVAEAYFTPFHFPSHPGHLWGITMPLDPVVRSGCREVLHPPLRGETAVEGSIGRLLRLESFRVRYDLDNRARVTSLRASQRSRLRGEFPVPPLTEWLTRHENLE
jgi:hypothetical protein